MTKLQNKIHDEIVRLSGKRRDLYFQDIYEMFASDALGAFKMREFNLIGLSDGYCAILHNEGDDVIYMYLFNDPYNALKVDSLYYLPKDGVPKDC